MIDKSYLKRLVFAVAVATTIAGLAVGVTPRLARAAATGYCLDSGGDSSQSRVSAYLYRDCGSSSTNLKWIIQNGQIKNAA